MPRVSFKYGLTDEDRAIAKENGIAISTVYARLRTGWEKQRAIMEKPRAVPFAGMERDENGEVIGERPKGKTRAFALPRDMDDQLDRAIAESGKTQSEFVSDLVLQYLSSKKKSSRKAGR
jgi:hypothetical protein